MSREDYLGLAWRNESALAIFCQRDNALLSQYACARASACVKGHRAGPARRFVAVSRYSRDTARARARLNSFPRVGDAIRQFRDSITIGGPIRAEIASGSSGLRSIKTARSSQLLRKPRRALWPKKKPKTSDCKSNKKHGLIFHLEIALPQSHF